MTSPQTLGEADRQIVAAWAADCAEHVLHLFERSAPGDDRPRELIARARAYAAGELDTASAIRRRFGGGVSAAEPLPAEAHAAARSAGQAAAVAHLGAHALGAAGYAVRAAGLAAPGDEAAVAAEIGWQVDRLTGPARSALRQLPRVGENSAGPLGPGLLSSGALGAIIADLQEAIGDGPDPGRRIG